jgi:hypothetical protein
MAGKAPDLAGQRFGALVVIQRAANRGKSACWLATCDCGKQAVIRATSLRTRHSISCGCLRGNLRHGMNKTPTYVSWAGMIQRATNPNRNRSARYVERGIQVCSRWRSFSNFYADMGKRPEGRTLDRIDNDRGYEPGNCRWATRSEQSKNRAPFKRYRSRAGEPAFWGLE